MAKLSSKRPNKALAKKPAGIGDKKPAAVPDEGVVVGKPVKAPARKKPPGLLGAF